MQSVYLPIHMSDPDRDTGEFSHISIRTPGQAVARGRLTMGRRGCRFELPARAAAAVAATADLYDRGVRTFVVDHAEEPLVRRIVADVSGARRQVRLEFMDHNDRVLRLYRSAGGRAQGRLLIDASWAHDVPAEHAEGATHFAGLMLLGTLSLLAADTDQRLGIYRVFDLHRLLLGASQAEALQAFLRHSAVDCGHVFANAFRCVADAALAREQDDLDLSLLDHVATEDLFAAGLVLERLRFEERGGRLRQAVWRLARDTCGQVPALAPERGEAAEAYADRVLRAVEDTLKWRDKWATWARMQDRLDFPYPQDYVLDLLDREWEDIDEERATVNQVVSKHYDFDVEGENIHRITAWAADHDIRLVAGRLSRAFSNQAHLLSTAKYMDHKVPLQRLALQIEGASRHDDVVHTAATRVLHLVQELRHTPYARLVGALNAFDDTVVRHQAQQARQVLDAADQASRHLLSRSSVDVSRRRIAASAERTEKLLALSARLRKTLDECPKRPAAYVVQLQRLHPGESINLANANAFREVHSGKEEDLRDLLRQGGDYIYSAPGPGRYVRDGQVVDTHWIIEVNDWIEAIPLFIKERVVRRLVGTGADAAEVESIETEVDQEAMEAFFRIHAQYWARNLDAVMDSERVAVARQLLVAADPRARRAVERALQEDPAVGRDEAVRQALVSRRDPAATARTVAALALLVEVSEEALVDTVHETVARLGLPRRQALRQVLAEDHPSAKGNAVGRLLKRLAAGAEVQNAVAAACRRLPARRRARRPDYESIALRRTRPVSALHVLTTESAGMTEGYVQSWIEEEMSLFNVVRAHGLADEVRREVSTYRGRLYQIGRRVIDDLGMGVVVEEVMADERFTPQLAVATVVGSYRPVAEQVGILGALLEVAGDEAANLDCEPIRDIAAVETYLEAHGDELAAAAGDEVADSNGHAFEQRWQTVRQQRPDLSPDAARRVVIDSESDYREEFVSRMRCRARVAVLAEIDRARPELHLAERADTFVRTYAQLAQSTARKRVVARHGLQAETSDPRYYYQATGGNKRYHLLYTPSRVNLGHRERDSVVRWSQWVGGADADAAQAGFDFYSLVNEGGVEERPALAYAEIQKTAENGLTVTHFAGSNALALLCMSVREGDVQDMADQMNLREDRSVPPAGEGYGGYCVPKDGLFLAFVLSLTNQVKLRQMGVPDQLHEGIMALARRALARKGDFETEFAWQRWAASELLRHEILAEYLDVDAQDRLVFHVTKIARALENLGRPWLAAAPGHRMVANLAADWAVQKMVVHAEQVNRFMVFYKAWCIYDGLRQARDKWPACAADAAARINVSAEYKPVQDVRFSTGLRLLEIFAKTGDHLHYALDEEGQNLVHLIFSGFDPDTHDRVGRRAAHQVMQTLRVAPADAEGVARLRAAFPGHPPPADVVVTSVSMSSTNDMLFYTSDARLDEIANQVQVQLGDYGLTEEQIRANCEVYGGDLRRWAGISHLPADQVSGLVARVGGAVHALVLKLRGPGRDYERDVQGVDVLNTGIPFPQLLELVQDPPKLAALMLQGNPNSALVLADGCAGRVPRALTEYDIQAWFAACERFGRRGTYTGIGLGQRIVERLEADMHLWRERGNRILEALVALAGAGVSQRRAAVDRALAVYAEVQRALVDNDDAGKALRQEQRARRYGKWTPRDAYVSQARVKVASGLPLGRLDAGTFIAGLGGAFVLMGQEQARIDALLAAFVAGVARAARSRRTADAGDVAPFAAADVDAVRRLMLRPAYHPDPARFTQQKLVESSSKAVEIAAVEALERRRALRVRAEKAKAMSDRQTGFDQVYGAGCGDDFDAWEQSARQDLAALQQRVEAFDLAAADAEPSRGALNVLFGRVIGATRGGLEALAARLWTGAEATPRLAAFRGDLERVLGGREVVLEDWKRLAGGYEDIGGLARLAQTAALADPQDRDRVARGMELYYTVFALAQTLQFVVDDPDAIDARVLYKNLTDFFAETINDHWYPYAPWCFDRGTAFDDLDPEALYRLAADRHAWLYRYIRHVLVRCTDLRHLSAADVDDLLGRVNGDVAVTGIGGGAGSPDECRWRVYNQLRELCFMHSDGFPTPPVFREFDPDLIEAHQRVNVVFLYPVGRTHVSRALREAPTLNRALQDEGRRGANLLITRFGEVTRFDGAGRDQLGVRDAHFYVDRDTFVAALQRHRGLSADQAEAEARAAEGRGALTAKGIRIAARFVRHGRPVAVPVGSLIPFHGLPVYDSGHTEDLGLPATVQSLVFSDVTYDKSLYPQIFAPASGVHTPPEIDWLQDYDEGRGEAEVKGLIADGVPGTDYPGLRQFAAAHTIVLIKGAAESGARNLKVFDLQDDAGCVDAADLAEAVDFLYDVSRRQSVVVQAAILTSPEFWATPQLMQSFVDRQILDWNTAVQRDHLPRSQIYGSLRVIATAPDPDTPYQMAFPIFLASLQVATNVGRGGTLEKLLDEFVQERYRHQIRPGLEAEARKVMAAMAAYAPGHEKAFRRRRGRAIGADARGVPYAWPPYLMLDFLVSPVFDRPGRLVDIEPVHDATGQRTGAVPVVQDETGRHHADIVDWRFVHLEPNVGIGLWDRFNLREEVLETRAAESEERDFDWARVGTSDRIVLRNFVIAGEQYLDAVRA